MSNLDEGVIVVDNITTDIIEISDGDVIVVTDEVVTIIEEGIQGPEGIPGPQGLQGIQGPKGDRGEQGLPGSGSAQETYEHVQSVASAQWIIDHNLNRFPSVTVVTSSGDEVDCGVRYDSANRITILSNSAFGGKAYLN